MGIPRLTTHLEPLQIQTTLGCTNRDCPNHAPPSPRSAIIDGPGLAYIIFYKLLGRNDAKTALAAHPSYQELSAAVLSCLRLFERCGLTVKHIYFDGALPESKQPTRLNRLLDTLSRLSTYRTIHPGGFKVTKLRPLDFSRRPQELFYSWSAPAFASNLPASPFLVPAVFEALKGSEFAGRTQLVPGEADPYLAAASRTSEDNLCLTGDSDLAIFDLGEATLSFFSSLDAQTCSECGQGTVLRGKVLRQKDVVGKIGLNVTVKDLIDLGFELQEDNHVGFEEAIRRISKQTSKAHKARAIGHVNGLNAFKANYEQEIDLSALRNLPEWQQNLDNRLSEVVVHAFSTKESVQHSYLLPLIEDTERASAWTPSRSIRCLAYSVLAVVTGSVCKEIVEYGRSGLRIVESTIDMLPQDEMFQQLDTMKDQLQLATHQCQQQDPVPAHIIHAVMYICQWHVYEGKTPPEAELIASALGAHQTAKLSWQSIHLKAQMHAVLFSIRMLNQMLLAAKVSISMDLTKTRYEPQILRIQDIILKDSELAATDLAKHAEWIVRVTSGDNADDQQSNSEANDSAPTESQGNEPNGPWKAVDPKGGKKRKRKRAEALPAAQKVASTKASTNPFDLLRS